MENYIDQAISAWLTSSEHISGSKITRRNYGYVLADFRRWLATKALDLDLAAWIDPGDQEAWSLPEHKTEWRQINARFRAELTEWAGNLKGGEGRAADGTIAGRISMVSSFYIHACNGWFSDYPNPCLRVNRPQVDANERVQSIPTAMVAEGMGRIDRSSLEGGRDFALLCIFLLTGRRIIEVTRLRWGDVELIGSLVDLSRLSEIRLAINFARIKGGDQARHELDNAASLALLESMARIYEINPLYLDGSRPLWPDLTGWTRSKEGLRALSVNAIRGIVYRRLGSSHVHRLRHSFAQQCLEAGLSLPDIARLLGHSNLATLSVYLQALAVQRGENQALPHLARVFNIH